MSTARRTAWLPAVDRSELVAAAAAAGATALIAIAASRKLGAAGLYAPLALAAAVIFLRHPLFAVVAVTSLTVICEGPTFGILTFTSHLYTQVYHDLSMLDVLVAIMVLAVAVEMLRTRRSPRVPGPLRFPLLLLALAMVVGFIVGYASGGSLRFVAASENVLAYLLVVPVAVANLELDRRQVRALLAGAGGLAILKAVLGLIEVASGHGQSVEEHVTITYYEPLANWLIMVALLAVLAMALKKARPPLWLLTGTPLMLASLVLSYRRSFWIAFALALVLVLLLGLSPMSRRVVLPGALAVGLAIWLVGAVHFQSSSPITKRIVSLQPSRIEANVEDRYRLDERANVLAEIGQHPIAGLGMTIPWAATARPLPVEHENGRAYVHFAALWYWLKLGILGLFAYIAVLAGSAVLAWQVWRRNRAPELSAFGLASFCAIIGLAVIETTASFTGVDGRFTVLFAVQLGLLATLARVSRRTGA